MNYAKTRIGNDVKPSDVIFVPFKVDRNEEWGWMKVDPDTLCQFTGLTDKNGEKIWENDICKITSDTLDGYEYFICKYESENARYVFEHNNIIIEFGDIYPYEIDTVGNIFDNLELLEV